VSRSEAGRWTEPTDVLAGLQRRWARGDLLGRHARAETWEPVSLPVRGPTPSELAADLGAAQAWALRWRAAHPRHLRVGTTTVGGRVVGANEVPSRVWIDTPESLWALLGVGPKVREFDELATLTTNLVPALGEWIAAHPMRVLDKSDVWPRALAVVAWVSTHDPEPTYLRQVDVPGVDTKFLETNRALLCDLLGEVLPPERIDQSAPRTDLAARFGFRRKPEYVRLRTLDSSRLLPGGFLEVTARADDIASLGSIAQRVLIIENEITYLALPEAPDMIAVLGSGYGLGRLARIGWLHEVELLYWGDLDTHGFAILDGLRAHFPRTRSILMDRTTLLDHESHWGHEPAPSRSVLTRLTEHEQLLYADLWADVFGPSVRLEQERVRYHLIREALEASHLHG
jgi:hypothetical protein